MANAREKNVWDVHALELMDFPVYPPEEVMQWLRDKIEDLNPGSVLDVGCGVGLMSCLFTSEQYCGIDQNETMIAGAQENNLNYEFKLNSGWEITCDDARFDMVFTRAVVQHNTEMDKSTLVSELVRVLSPGGHYLFCEDDFLTDGKSARQDVVDYLEPFGLELVDTAASCSYLFSKRVKDV
ncbi:hypothetical protein LCGC14_0914020 [marine sediment metagenome]|uniref:Methyltransferase domain-containing protein n=1 Tax=marine sediment metagenome TaxID=412755 RepID=A0A0F9PDH7_9ZZZZ